MDKSQTASGYSEEALIIVRATCLYVATKLGDLFENKEITVVGGLVPSLLLPREKLGDGVDPHVGTTDLDLGLAIRVLEEEHYEELANRMTEAGFEHDENQSGNKTLQRWRLIENHKVLIDFLIDQRKGGPKPSKLEHMKKMAACVTPGLHLAFQDQEDYLFSNEKTIKGALATKRIRICGPGAFVVLKSLAYQNRGRDKDAYDLHYVVRHYGKSVDDVVSRLKPLLTDPVAKKALEALEENFFSMDHIGPISVESFLGEKDEALSAVIAQ